jgi:hypothetical protein
MNAHKLHSCAITHVCRMRPNHSWPPLIPHPFLIPVLPSFPTPSAAFDNYSREYMPTKCGTHFGCHCMSDSSIPVRSESSTAVSTKNCRRAVWYMFANCLHVQDWGARWATQQGADSCLSHGALALASTASLPYSGPCKNLHAVGRKCSEGYKKPTKLRGS